MASTLGDVVGNILIICGGISTDLVLYDSCYILNQDNQWTFLSNMSKPREKSGAISIPEGIWVTGGISLNGAESSTEFIFVNGSRASGPQLPDTRHAHCVVRHEHQIFIIGGYLEFFGKIFRFCNCS